MKATITWTCCWCQISSMRFECQSPSSPPRSWTRRSRVRLGTEQRCPIRPEGSGGCGGGVMRGRVRDDRVPGLHSSPCCSFSPAYTSMHQAWKAKEKRSSRREGGRTTAFRRFSHSWHCSKVENWHLGIKNKSQHYTFSMLQNLHGWYSKKSFYTDIYSTDTSESRKSLPELLSFVCGKLIFHQSINHVCIIMFFHTNGIS